MAAVTPWYYRLYWRMESWLTSQTYKTLNRNRDFFSRLLADKSTHMKKLQVVRADNGESAFYLRNKPMHDGRLMHESRLF
jgi:ferritin